MKCMESGIWNFVQSACVCDGGGGGGDDAFPTGILASCQPHTVILWTDCESLSADNACVCVCALQPFRKTGV